MIDTVDKLMMPRIKVIAPMPLMTNKVGSFLYYLEGSFGIKTIMNDQHYYPLEYFKIWPHIFKICDWWEERTIDEMPEYVKDIRTGHFYKVLQPYHNSRIWHSDFEMEMIYLQRYASNYLPATKEEYDQFINQTK